MSVALANRVHEMAEELAKLQRQVEVLHASKTGSMKQTQCCPACGNRTILHFTRVTERANANLQNMALAHTAGWRGIGNLGELEAFACRACGRVEWYAMGLDAVEVDGEIVRLLQADPVAPDAGPYR